MTIEEHNLMTALSQVDADQLRATFADARALATAGQYPFTARLVDEGGTVFATARNEVEATGDSTAHAELTLVRRVAGRASRGDLARMTMYAAAEPCAMCAAAIVWSGVGRLVYGLSAEWVRRCDPLPAGVAEPGISGRALLEVTVNGPALVGPVLEEEARAALFLDHGSAPT